MIASPLVLASHTRRVVAVLALVAALSCAFTSHVHGQRASEADVPLRILVTNTAAEAESARARLLAGQSFDVLARQLSIDASARDGGFIGRVAPSSLRADLQQALRGLAPGQPSAIVRIATGYAIVRIDPAGGTSPATGGLSADVPGAGLNASLSATGSVKIMLEVSGFGEARTTLAHHQPSDWNARPDTLCSARTASLANAHTALSQRLTSLQSASTSSPGDLLEAHMAIALLHAYDGVMTPALEHFTAARAVAGEHAPETAVMLDEVLGIAHLHAAEVENDVQASPGHQFLLSEKGFPPLAKPAHAEQAIGYFEAFLRKHPEAFEVTWLLNLAYMATGGYPGKVPPAHLIAPEALAAAGDVGRFPDIATALGLESVSMAGGVIVDDFDNDGSLEVVTSSMENCGPMRYFARGANGRYADGGTRSGLAAQVGALNIVQGDYDNDGCVDILVLRGGWELSARKSLMRNRCDGTFEDVTEKSGLARPLTATQTAAWTDIDNDGHLDIFIGNENAPAQLFLNQQDGTFIEVGAAAGIARASFAKGVAAGDFDNDGWQDLYVSTLGGSNMLYRNQRDGTFANVTAAAGVPGPERGFATWFFDYDNDGWQDLFATSYYLSVEETARGYMKLPLLAPTMRLYRNRGDGTFEDVTTRVGLDRPLMPMGSNFGDIDNDGWLDMYLGTGSPSYGALTPSLLMRNDEGRSFVDVTASAGVGELFKGHGVAFADLDGDGDEEIVFVVGGATQGDRHALRVFENPGHGNRWVEVTLVGSTSNRSAIGTRITVTVANADGTQRVVHRTVGSGGSFGASPLRQHIGLGKAERIISVETWWPKSGVRQRFTDVPLDKWIEARETATTFTVRDRLPRPTPSAP